jgi:hypothetical protein
MTRAADLRAVIDELANALQTAIGLSAVVRRETQTAADDAVALDAAMRRAIAALTRLQPPTDTRRGRRR